MNICNILDVVELEVGVSGVGVLSIGDSGLAYMVLDDKISRKPLVNDNDNVNIIGSLSASIITATIN